MFKPVLESRVPNLHLREPEPVNLRRESRSWLKNPKKAPASRAFLEGARAGKKNIESRSWLIFFRGTKSRELGAGEKGTGSPTLVLTKYFKIEV